MAIDREMLLKFLQFFCLQQPTAMGKAIQRKIEFVLKRKRDDISENEDVVPPTNDTLSLLEVEQQAEQNHAEHADAEVPQANGPVTFQGIEFLQRDPGLRPQIWQYPPDQRDSVRRAYLLLGPMQPQLQNYKLSGEQSRRRRF
jgi:hypothetical protein